MLTHWRTSQITQTRAHESLLFSMYCWIKKTYPQQTFNKIYYTSLPRFPSLHSCSLHQFFLATDGQKKTHTLWLFQMLSYLCHCLSSPPFKHLSTLFFPQTLRTALIFQARMLLENTPPLRTGTNPPVHCGPHPSSTRSTHDLRSRRSRSRQLQKTSQLGEVRQSNTRKPFSSSFLRTWKSWRKFSEIYTPWSSTSAFSCLEFYYYY